MATSLRFKVYDRNGEMIASCRWPGQAVELARRAGAMAKIKHMDWGILWSEGTESPCTMSEREAVTRIMDRIDEKRAEKRKQYEKTFGKAKA